MRELLQNVINKMGDDEIPILFGEGSKIIIDDFNFSDYQGLYYVSLKLVDCDPEIAVEVFPDALELLFHDIWVCLPSKHNYILTCSMNH